VPVKGDHLISFLFIQLIFIGIGIGTVFGSLMTAYARNPSLKQQLFTYAVLGFALAEAMGLFCLMVAMLLLFGL
jgi:F-type H+-transporting ATPase subunit c